MNILINYIKFIIWQDVEKPNMRKIFTWIHLIFRYFFAAFYVWGMFYISTIVDIPKIFRYILAIYGSLAILTTVPCRSIQEKKDDGELEHWLPNFGYYNNPSIILAPIYLFKYCLALEKDKENNN